MHSKCFCELNLHFLLSFQIISDLPHFQTFSPVVNKLICLSSRYSAAVKGAISSSLICHELALSMHL